MLSHPVIIRPVEMRDVEGLRTIYNWAVDNTTATLDTEPRSPEAQALWVAQHDGLPYPGIIAANADGGELIGYASLSRFNPRAGYRTTAEVSIYVHCDWHSLGIGSALLSSLLVEADRRGFVSLIALISSDNEASLRLHRRYGFQEIGKMDKIARKFDKWVDVSILQRIAPEQGA